MDKKQLFLYGYMALITVITAFLGMQIFIAKEECSKKTAVLEKEVLVLKQLLKGKETQLTQVKKEKEKLVAKLKNIEEKIKKANKYLRRKGIKITAPEPQGGIFIPENSKDIQIYAEKITYSMDKLIKIIQDIPVGVPLYGRITSRFGYRKDPFNGKRAFHSGLDFRASFKQPIFATANGVVEYAGLGRGYGKMVKIKHKYGYETIYAHMYYIKVRAGQRVKAGQIIGYAGSTGRSTGVHLHYEIRRYGKLVNPLKMLYLNNKNRL